MKDGNSLKNFLSLLTFVTAICVLTQIGWSQNADGESAQVHQPTNATTQFDIHPGLEVGLFAAEPLIANPSNIDIDHLGRVWVCEAVSYTHLTLPTILLV